MLTLFRYNWQVRDEWFEWCKRVPPEELVRQRRGGVGSILRTLFHVVDVEQSWIRALQGKPDIEYRFESYATLPQIIALSNSCRPEVEQFVVNWKPEMERLVLSGIRKDGTSFSYSYGEVLRHVVAHEIHHMGQLSVWAREIGKEPVSANFIGRSATAEPGTKGFSHVTIDVSNLEKSLDFYVRILGMKVVHRGRRDAYLEWGSAWVCLQERPELPPQTPQLGVDHVAFFIDPREFHSAVEVLRQANVPIVRGPVERGGGWTVNFLDPDGIQLELHTGTLSERMKVWK